jgi:hypothetical protein
MAIVNQIDPIPNGKLEESPIWRDWLTKIATYLARDQQSKAIPTYTTANLPTSTSKNAPRPGDLVYDSTVGVLKIWTNSSRWERLVSTYP